MQPTVIQRPNTGGGSNPNAEMMAAFQLIQQSMAAIRQAHQFDRQMEAEAERLGLSRDQFNAQTDQFAQSMVHNQEVLGFQREQEANLNRRFGQTQSLETRRLKESERQFNEAAAERASRYPIEDAFKNRQLGVEETNAQTRLRELLQRAAEFKVTSDQNQQIITNALSRFNIETQTGILNAVAGEMGGLQRMAVLMPTVFTGFMGRLGMQPEELQALQASLANPANLPEGFIEDLIRAQVSNAQIDIRPEAAVPTVGASPAEATVTSPPVTTPEPRINAAYGVQPRTDTPIIPPSQPNNVVAPPVVNGSQLSRVSAYPPTDTGYAEAIAAPAPVATTRPGQTPVTSAPGPAATAQREVFDQRTSSVVDTLPGESRMGTWVRSTEGARPSMGTESADYFNTLSEADQQLLVRLGTTPGAVSTNGVAPAEMIRQFDTDPDFRTRMTRLMQQARESSTQLPQRVGFGPGTRDRQTGFPQAPARPVEGADVVIPGETGTLVNPEGSPPESEGNTLTLAAWNELTENPENAGLVRALDPIMARLREHYDPARQSTAFLLTQAEKNVDRIAQRSAERDVQAYNDAVKTLTRRAAPMLADEVRTNPGLAHLQENVPSLTSDQLAQVYNRMYATDVNTMSAGELSASPMAQQRFAANREQIMGEIALRADFDKQYGKDMTDAMTIANAANHTFIAVLDRELEAFVNEVKLAGASVDMDPMAKLLLEAAIQDYESSGQFLDDAVLAMLNRGVDSVEIPERLAGLIASGPLNNRIAQAYETLNVLFEAYGMRTLTPAQMTAREIYRHGWLINPSIRGGDVFNQRDDPTRAGAVQGNTAVTPTAQAYLENLQ